MVKTQGLPFCLWREGGSSGQALGWPISGWECIVYSGNTRCGVVSNKQTPFPLSEITLPSRDHWEIYLKGTFPSWTKIWTRPTINWSALNMTVVSNSHFRASNRDVFQKESWYWMSSTNILFHVPSKMEKVLTLKFSVNNSERTRIKEKAAMPMVVQILHHHLTVIRNQFHLPLLSIPLSPAFSLELTTVWWLSRHLSITEQSGSTNLSRIITQQSNIHIFLCP